MFTMRRGTMKNSYFIFALCAATLLTSTAMALTQFEVDCTKLDPRDPRYCPNALAPDPSFPGTTIGGNVGEIEAGDAAIDNDKNKEDIIKGDLIDSEFPGGSSGTTTETPTIVDDANKYVPSTNLNCHSISCADLGYTQTSVANCETYVRCPFDVSYQICAKYADNYNLTSCPAGANCTAKYKVTSCKTGYLDFVNLDTGEISCTPSMVADTCTASLTSCPTGWECTSCTKSGKTYYAKTENCATGYEKGEIKTFSMTGSSSGSLLSGSRSSSGSLLSGSVGTVSGDNLNANVSSKLKGCYKSVCKVIAGRLGETSVKLDNGGYIVIGCEDDYTQATSLDGCIICNKTETILPVDPNEEEVCPTFDTCPTGSICSQNRITKKYVITACDTGYKPAGVTNSSNTSCIDVCLKYGIIEKL